MVRTFLVRPWLPVRGLLERLSMLRIQSVRGLDPTIDAHDGLRRLEELLVLVPHRGGPLLDGGAHGWWLAGRAGRSGALVEGVAAAERLPRGAA